MTSCVCPHRAITRSSSAGLGARYVHPSGLFGNVRARYTDASFSNVNNDPTGVNDEFFIVNLIAGYEAGRHTVEVFANNAFDEDYLTFNPADPNSGAISFAGDPRMVGARVVLDF